MLSNQLTDFVRANLTEVGLLLKAVREIQEAKRYNPNQPRVSAGSAEGGQWVATGGADGASVDSARQRFSARYDPSKYDECDAQRNLDYVICSASGSLQCYRLLHERFNNCMRGAYIPELRHGDY